MSNVKQTNSSQKGKEDQSVDLKQLVFLFLSHWYLFAAFVIVALGVCFLVNRYSTRVYQTTGTILIKEDKNEYDPTTIMTTMDFANMQNIDNEIAILTSYMLRERVVKKMGVEVTYLEKGRIANKELYKKSPFLVEFEHSFPQAVGLAYEITFLENGKIGLQASGEGLNRYDFILCQPTENNPFARIDISGEYTEGEWIDNGYNRIRITKTELFDPETIGDSRLFFWLNSYPSLVNQMSSYTVSPVSKKASVAKVSMKGANRAKIVEFVNLLMNEYVVRGLEKKNLVSDNTITYIDNELSGIQ